jgi:hypothetical protein
MILINNSIIHQVPPSTNIILLHANKRFIEIVRSFSRRPFSPIHYARPSLNSPERATEYLANRPDIRPQTSLFSPPKQIPGTYASIIV